MSKVKKTSRIHWQEVELSKQILIRCFLNRETKHSPYHQSQVKGLKMENSTSLSKMAKS